MIPEINIKMLRTLKGIFFKVMMITITTHFTLFGF